MFLSILINGLVSGGTYAVLALGFSLIFGAAKILNLAHTAFYMMSAFIIYTLTVTFGIRILPAAILAIIIIGPLGMVCYRLCFDRVKVHESAVLIISVSIGMIIQEVLLIIFKEHYRVIPPFFPGVVDIAGVRVLYQQIFAIVTSFLTLAAVWFLLSKTRLGKAIRAVDQDIEIANAMGIDVTGTSMKVMGISSVLAGVAGISVAPLVTVHPLMWLQPLVIVLSAVVLGGLGSIKGSVLAAFILGFAETIVVFLVPGGSFLRGAVSLSVMVVILLARPEGLFGIVFEEERL